MVNDVNVNLRRGGWYEVSRLTPEAVIVEINQRVLNIPRSCLQIVPVRPRQWSVVPRPYDAIELPLSWGSRYAVCPECRQRAAAVGPAGGMECPGCHGVFPIRLG